MYYAVALFYGFLFIDLAQWGQADAPTIISRKDWNARNSTIPSEKLSQIPSPFIIIHHSDTPPCDSMTACKARVQSIQDYHMDSNKWDDIGYNFLLGGDGNIYEGRGWNVRGAHSPNYNAKSLGICFIGRFHDKNPVDPAVESLNKLLRYGVDKRYIDNDYTLLGHRQTRSTTCPGDSLYAFIQTMSHWKEI